MTTRKLDDILQKSLSNIRKQSEIPIEQIKEFWPSVVGEKIAGMSHVLKFYEGVLTVSVRNATLLSLLSQYEKQRILKQYRKVFPNVSFLDARFRLG